MTTIIPASDVGRLIYEDAIRAVEETIPEASQAEKDECLAALIGALSVSYFK